MKKIRIEKVKNFRFSSNSRPRTSKNASNSRSPKHSTALFTKLNLANPQLRSIRNNDQPSIKPRKMFNFFPETPKKSNLLRTSTHSKRSKIFQIKDKIFNSSDKRVNIPNGIPIALFLKDFRTELIDLELSEILGYKVIYYWGDNEVKVQKAAKYKTCDDESGNLLLFKGDHIAYRYEIVKILGYGSFGQVCECVDHKDESRVAVKIIKSPKNFSLQAESEIRILKYIKDTSLDSSLPIINLQDTFVFRKHVCIVTELMGPNLYEVQQNKKFCQFPVPLIRSFAIQILTALKFLNEHKIIHCDLKLENILVSSSDKKSLKIIDFGSSCFVNEKVFSYIQSRYYRAPEVVLNLNYSCGIDMWSFGCVLAELANGKPLFPAECERELLQLMMQVKGKVPDEMIDKSIKRNKFFVNGNIVPDKYGNVLEPGALLFSEAINGEKLFVELVGKCLEWNPISRITPQEALEHPWILADEPKTLKKSQILKLLRRTKFFKNKKP